MTNNVDLTIPAKRYFTLDELCRLLQIEPEGFARWQHDHGVVVGYGGEHYTRFGCGQTVEIAKYVCSVFG